MSTVRPPRLTISLTRGEVECLYEEIGELSQLVCGPKLRQLHSRLEASLELNWEAERVRRSTRRRAQAAVIQ